MKSAPLSTACALDAAVVSCTPVCRDHVRIDLAAPALPSSEPGQFLQLLCRPDDTSAAAELDWPAGAFPRVHADQWNAAQAYLRRPFGIADHWIAPDGVPHACVISHSIGTGTRWLAQLRPRETLNITGPLGRGFTIPQDARPLVLVGGGVGIPPLLYLARRLREQQHEDVTVILGARQRDLMPVPLNDEPDASGAPRPCVTYPGGARYPTVITSDDGSLGLRGFVTDALCLWAEQRPDAHRAIVYACGPDAMLRAVANATRAMGSACQLCIERNMGCGLGTCLSCIVKGRDPQQTQGWRWRLTCQDGPVFDRDELIDYGPALGA